MAWPRPVQLRGTAGMRRRPAAARLALGRRAACSVAVHHAAVAAPTSSLVRWVAGREAAEARGVRVRVTGSGPTKGMPVLSVAWHRGSSSG
eukprot:353972-Chlamydomonas_euryale.AAC.8